MTIHLSSILSSDPSLKEADIVCNEPTARTLKAMAEGGPASPLKIAFDEFVCDWISSKFHVVPRAFEWDIVTQ